MSLFLSLMAYCFQFQKTNRLMVSLFTHYSKIADIQIMFRITSQVWDQVIHEITDYLALHDLFLELLGHITMDPIVQIMSKNKILEKDNNRQELYKKVSYAHGHCFFIFITLEWMFMLMYILYFI